jgi:arylsulfatase A-like enzyme
MKRLFALFLIVLPLIFVKPSMSSGPPNIILLTVDTLRADRMGSYGYKHNTSPNLDKLARNGALFLDASTNVPLTNPSFCSLFTSRYPHETGAIRNGIPMVDDIPTMAMIFKENGYHTAAILSNWPLKRHLSNLHRGFDIYNDDFKEKRYLFFNAERDAEGVTDDALTWLDKGPKEPFFVWIHYSDPHSPYLKKEGHMFEKNSTDSTRYDSEVAFTDKHIGRLLDELDKKGVMSRSTILFTSDHGESLGEHSYTGHGRRVYQPGMHVPFIISGPGIKKGQKHNDPVQLLDIAPTLIAQAGIKVPDDMLGIDLYPFIKGEAELPERTIYFETYPGAAPQVAGAEKMLKKPIWVGIRKGREKLTFSTRFQRWEKYDLEKDPAELENIAKIRDPEFITESDSLLDWYREWEDDTVVGQIGAMSEEDLKKFEALGYVGNP